ncbi:MAG: hypothetical protein HUK15_00450 [Bacteroidales bacterium]|nr:hypothetical protein [Bacteroidales bacterium]
MSFLNLLIISVVLGLVNPNFVSNDSSDNAKIEDSKDIAQVSGITEKKLLDTYGSLMLYSCVTEQDRRFNLAQGKDEENFERRNSLMLYNSHDKSYKIILTSIEEGQTPSYKALNKLNLDEQCVNITEANLSRDGKYVYLICNPFTMTYFCVYCYDLQNNTLRYLSDGDSLSANKDGSVWIYNVKTYLSHFENGEEVWDGAAWYNVRMTASGKILEKTKPEQN